MTTRAKRLNKYLKDQGWNTEDENYESIYCKCGHIVYNPLGQYCPKCGTKHKLTKRLQDTIDVLESAIKYALGEK
jgi:uncharacterized OB-fold protein